MPCTRVRMEGVTAIVCSRGRRQLVRCGVQGCAAAAEYQCDYPAGDGQTCDRHLCKRHAGIVGKDQHYCPPCIQLWRKALKEGTCSAS